MAGEEPKSRAVRLRITSCTHGYTGKNQRGDEYTIYEIEAVKEDGSKVNENLRSFEDLPLEVLDLNVKPFKSDRHGTSFTLSRRNKPKSAELIAKQQEEIDELKLRLGRVEEYLRRAPWREQSQPQPQSQPQADPQPQPVAAADDIDARFGA